MYLYYWDVNENVLIGLNRYVFIMYHPFDDSFLIEFEYY